jgi:hypothetical protein
MSTTKKLWLGIGILILFSPLGLIIPNLMGAGGAWGEWGLDEIQKIAGFVPEGMKRLAELWRAPLPDYALPGRGKGLLHGSIGYILTAVIGVALAAGIMYLLAKLVGRKNDKK